MQNKNDYITMLGTGNAHATRCYNTCFTLHGKESVLLVDAGGGNGILTQLEFSRCNVLTSIPRKNVSSDLPPSYQAVGIYDGGEDGF